MTPRRPAGAGRGSVGSRDAGFVHDTREARLLLTNREMAVLNLLAGGLITTAIARRLGISPRTVAKHLEQAYRKLGANDRVSAVLRAHSLGLVPSQPTKT